MFSVAGAGAIFSFFAILSHYTRYAYGNQQEVLGLPFVMGTAERVKVQLVVAKELVKPLTNLGVQVSEDSFSDVVELLDETSSHYIIRVKQQAIKLARDQVKAIRYKP